MFGEECTLPMDVGLPRRDTDSPDSIHNPIQFIRLYDKQAVKRVFAIGDWTIRYYPPAKKCKLDSPWLGPYLVVSIAGWAIGVQLKPDSPVLLVHCQDFKNIPRPQKLVPWL